MYSTACAEGNLKTVCKKKEILLVFVSFLNVLVQSTLQYCIRNGLYFLFFEAPRMCIIQYTVPSRGEDSIRDWPETPTF